MRWEWWDKSGLGGCRGGVCRLLCVVCLVWVGVVNLEFGVVGSFVVNFVCGSVLWCGVDGIWMGFGCFLSTLCNL